MKANVKPEISKKFVDQLPADLKCPDLRKALPKCAKALSDCERKQGDARLTREALTSLKDLKSAVDKAIRASKDKNCTTVLKKFDPLIKEHLSAIEATQSQGGDDDPNENEEKLSSSENITKMTKAMRQGKSLPFALCFLPNDLSNSVIMISRNKKPDTLFNLMRRQLKKNGTKFSKENLACGTATADEKDKQFLFLQFQDDSPPKGLKGKGRRWVKNCHAIVFKKLKYSCGGDVVEADSDVGEEDLIELEKAAQQYIKLWDSTLRNVSGQIDKLRSAIKNESNMGTLHERLGGVVGKFPDLDLSKLLAAAKVDDRGKFDQTLKQTVKEINDVYDLLANGPILKTIDENPFVNTTVHATIEKALTTIRDGLDI